MTKKKLIDMEMSEYLDLLKSDAPAPGGGSVSALAGCQGAALISMACELTVGREKYAEYESACLAAIEELEGVYDGLKEGIDKDTDAYDLVAGAFKLPKETEEEKAARSKAIQEGTITATEVPLQNMRLAHKGLEIAKGLAGKVNPNCNSDFGVGVLNLRVCLLGAYMNVAINLPGIKDQAKRDSFLEEAERVKWEAEKIADEIEDVLA